MNFYITQQSKPPREREGIKVPLQEEEDDLKFIFFPSSFAFSLHTYLFTNLFGRKRRVSSRAYSKEMELFQATLSLFMELYTKTYLHEDSLAAAWSKLSFQDC